MFCIDLVIFKNLFRRSVFAITTRKRHRTPQNESTSRKESRPSNFLYPLGTCLLFSVTIKHYLKRYLPFFYFVLWDILFRNMHATMFNLSQVESGQIASRICNKKLINWSFITPIRLTIRRYDKKKALGRLRFFSLLCLDWHIFTYLLTSQFCSAYT